MLPVTRPAANHDGSQPGKTNVLLETLLLFFVMVGLVGMVLAVSTVLQNGFQ